MDACPYEDAFPNIDTGSAHRGLTKPSGSGFPYVGGTDSKATREERRAARKKAKRCKGPALEYSNLMHDGYDGGLGGSMPAEVDGPGASVGGGPDADRPAVQRMGAVESMTDQRGNYNKIPVLPKASCLYSNPGTPSYFGAAGEDEAGEEGYANFRQSLGQEDYMLDGGDGGGTGAAAALNSFSLKGAAKAGGATLPGPNLNDSWKPMAPAASYTSYLNDLPSSGAAVPGWASGSRHMAPPAGPVEHPMEMPVRAPPAALLAPMPSVPSVVAAGGNPKEDRDALLGRIEALTGRLEELERTKRQDSQTEILMFVGTGLFMLFAFDLVSRVRR
jgi:hypothetical protein